MSHPNHPKECDQEHCICHTPAAPPKFDTLEFVVRYEGGELEEHEVVTGFQHLIDSGLVWQLQGSYGRTARNLIEAGLCALPARQ